MPTKPVPMEHRWGERIECRARVRISVADYVAGFGRVRNVSSSGAYIETPVTLTEGTQIVLFIRGNESATPVVEIPAIVVRVERDGAGVEWCETPAGSICAMVGCTKRCATRPGQPCLRSH